MIAPATLSPTRRAALVQVRELVLRSFAGHAARVWLFGSCAKGDARPRSDIDVAFEADVPIPDEILSDLIDALEESDVPYIVQVVDLSTAGDAFRQAVLDQGIQWA